MEIHIIDADDLEKHWIVLLPYIGSFIEGSRGRYESDDVFNNIKNHTWTIWVVHDDFEVKAVNTSKIIKIIE